MGNDDTSPVLPDNITILELQPDDVLVVTLPVRLNSADTEAIAAKVRAKFPNREVMVFSAGVELTVIRPAEQLEGQAAA